MQLTDLLALHPRELERLVQVGTRPAAEALAGHEFRGVNIFPAARLLRIRKFIKYFFLDPAGDVRGCNTPVVQNSLSEPWLALPDEANPRRFAYFAVAPVDPTSRDRAYPQAVLLDYGQGGNRPYDPARFIRDYLVRVDPGSDDVLLGKAYVALGPARVRVGFFALQRHRTVLAM